MDREPTVRRDSKGRWVAQLDLGRDGSGRRVRPSRILSGAHDEDEAMSLARIWARNVTADGRVRSARICDLLREYISDRKLQGAAPNTVRRWWLFERYVERYLPNRPVRDLSVIDMTRFETALLMPKAAGGQGLCPNSVISVHNFLSCAYDMWVSAGICDENPMRSVRRPRETHHEAVALDEWDYGRLESAISALLPPQCGDASPVEQRNAFGAWLALHTGLRCGEVCGLRRRDVSPSRRWIHVGGNVTEAWGHQPVRSDQTKGHRGRNVSLTDQQMEVVFAWIRAQDRMCPGLGPDAALVSCDGAFVRPTALSHGFSAIRDSCGIPRRVTFHSLRHTHATWLLAHGVDVKTVSERMGHANVSTTLAIYAHVMPGRDQAAAKALEEAEKQMKDGGKHAGR